MKQQFMHDLQKIYDELQTRQKSLNDYYKVLDGNHPIAKSLIEDFLLKMGLPMNSDTMMASLTRLVNLREDALEQVLQKEGFSQDEIIAKKEIAYLFVKEMHLTRHEYLIAWIKSENLLTPFYQVLIENVHYIGESLSLWQSEWTAHIINGINRDLLKEHDGDEQAVFKMLQEEELLDLDPNGEVGDRCYSVLVPNSKEQYHSVAYSEAFPNEVASLVAIIEDCIEALSMEVDDVFHQKKEWINYFVALKKAFAGHQPKKLIGLWANVDRAWMKITTPLQIGHPLEYYEDHFRKAVALEWDLRIINPELQSASMTRQNIKDFSAKLATELKGEVLSTIEKNSEQVDETQLYIGQPMMYYGAEFNGLFSAQVVPNDEQVSAEMGKKIFAYADFVRESKLHKPIMQLQIDVFGKEFIDKRRNLLENYPKLWHEVYAISTIGHEFGHILWMDEDTETVMNAKGQFKNIEEFKATTGGLMGFFEKEDINLREHIVDDLISRAVGLIAWKEVEEVLPYYCEGLIHLDILYNSGIIDIDGIKVAIDYSKYEDTKSLYQNRYKDLVECYIDKKDASEYLYRFVEKREKEYLPKNSILREFVLEYYKEFKARGHIVAK